MIYSLVIREHNFLKKIEERVTKHISTFNLIT